MRILGRLLLAALASALVLLATPIAGYFWISAHPGFLDKDARARHARLMSGGLTFIAPKGAGPFRTVLLVPGCGGIRRGDGPNPIMDEYAQSALTAGWAAAILDSYGPRGWDPAWARNRVCTGLRLPGLLRSADVMAGLDLLAADPRVDHRHVRIASWSHGGWAVGDLMTLRRAGGDFRQTLDGVEALRFTYPYCGQPARAARRAWTWRGDVNLVMAQFDTVQPPAGCDALVSRARAGGSTVALTVIPGVTHAFDERVQTPDSRFKFNPAASARSHQAFVAWLETPASRR